MCHVLEIPRRARARPRPRALGVPTRFVKNSRQVGGCHVARGGWGRIGRARGAHLVLSDVGLVQERLESARGERPERALEGRDGRRGKKSGVVRRRATRRDVFNVLSENAGAGGRASDAIRGGRRDPTRGGDWECTHLAEEGVRLLLDVHVAEVERQNLRGSVGAIGVRKRKDAWQPSPGTARYPAIEARDAREGRSADQIIILEVETHLCGVVRRRSHPARGSSVSHQRRVVQLLLRGPACGSGGLGARLEHIRGGGRLVRQRHARLILRGRRRACDVAVGTLREAHLEGTRAAPLHREIPREKAEGVARVERVEARVQRKVESERLGHQRVDARSRSSIVRASRPRACVARPVCGGLRKGAGTTTSFSAGKTFSSAEGRLGRIERRITQERRVKSTHPKIPSIRYVLFTSRDVPEWRETRRSFWNVSATWFRLGRFEDRRSNSGCDRWRSVKIPEAFRVFEAPRDLSDWAGIQSRLRPARALASGWVGSSWRTGAVRKKWENCIGARPSANNTARAEVVGGAR